MARALSRLLQRVGVVAEDKLVEVQRTDLVGEFVGHTGPKTRAVVGPTHYTHQHLALSHFNTVQYRIENT